MDSNTLRAYKAIFMPASVAIVGASNSPGKWGFIVPMNIFTGRYKGEVCLVNPNQDRILGCPAYRNLASIEKPVDLVIITVPAALVPGVIDDCGKLGIPSAVVISAGFSETGEEGARRERELVDRARDLNVLLVGPNCMGISSPPVGLYSTGAAVQPPAGNIAFLSQSGNLGVQMLAWGKTEGVGFSRFVSSGNEAMAGCDGFLEYFGEDPETDVIILYIEGIKRGERFFEVAHKVSRKKPILALKMGDTEAGAQAAKSHSGAIAGSRAAYDAICKQAGIVQANTTEELIDLARAFSSLPVPTGDKVGIMTMGGGWGVVTADKCAKEGLTLPKLSQKTLDAIDPLLPAFWSRSNPVDLVGTARRSMQFAVAETMADAHEFDSIISLGTMLGLSGSWRKLVEFFLGPWRNLRRRFGLAAFRVVADIISGARASLKKAREKADNNDPLARSRTGGIDLREIKQWRDELFAEKVIDLIDKHKKPIITVTMASGNAADIFTKYKLVAYSIPEKAVRSLARLTDYGKWLRKEEERDAMSVPEASRPVGDAHTLIEAFGAHPTEHDAKRLLQMYGLPVTPQILAHDKEAAVKAAGDIGYPVAMKVMSGDIPHKTEAGVIRLNVSDEKKLFKAYDELIANAVAFKPDAEINGVLVEKMVAGGIEIFVGVNLDPQFGHIILMGLGGIHVEVLQDIAMRVLPIHPDDCMDMIREIRGGVLLSGYRGAKPSDREALADALWKLSQLTLDLKEYIREIDLNPIMVLPEGQGCLIADALLIPKS